MLHEYLFVVFIILVGAGVGYSLARARATPSASSRRVHKTIAFDSSAQRADEELDAQIGDSPATTPTNASSSKKKHHSHTHHSASNERTSNARVEDVTDEEDRAETLAHMKTEHAQHLSQFTEDRAHSASVLTPDPTSPPVNINANRRIFIVAKTLPLTITNCTGRPTPHATPLGSPAFGPSVGMTPSTSIEKLNITNQLDEDGFSLGSAVASTPSSIRSSSSYSSNLTVPSSSPFSSHDLTRRRTASLGESLYGNDSSTTESATGTRFHVAWDDSRSFLANLRCLLPNSSNLNQGEIPSGMAPASSSTSATSPAAASIPSDNHSDVTWVGISNVTSRAGFQNEGERLAYEATLKENHCLPVYLDADVYEGYQNFNKSVLWPLLHYLMPTNTNTTVGIRWAEYWEAYTKANQAYADVITAQIANSTSSPNEAVEAPIVWIHNMQLFCLPQMIRQQLPRATIGLFIHTPFPSSDVFRSLPSRKEILSSLMEADLLGFHTFDYARHFLSCIKRVMDLDFETLPGGVLGVRYNGRFVSILISHVGIQSAVFRDLAESDVIKRRVEKLRAQHAGKKIIIGIDDVDVAKAPILKLQAFDRFLSRHPEWKDKIVILEMFLPSKNMESALGAKIQRDLDSYILELKRKYGDGIIQILAPIKPSKLDANGVVISEPQQQSGLKLMELVRLYASADVALISTFFDGLNLLPFELTASQDPNQPCALIISEFMGASRSMNGVIRVNPWSLEEISNALHAALSMSLDERRANHQRRYNYVMHHTIERWARGFLDAMTKATKLGAELNYVQVGSGTSNKKLLGLKSDFVHLPSVLLTNTYTEASMRIILLDYDGTLVPADKTEKAAASSTDPSSSSRPPTAVLRLLRFLSDDPRNVVFLMSGRTRSILTNWFGDIANLGLAAEKGLFLRWPQRIAAECRFDRKESATSRTPTRGMDDESEDSSSSSDEEESESESEEENEENEQESLKKQTLGVKLSDWECLVSLDDIAWKSTALEVIRAYTDQTDGSYVEIKEFAIVWHFEQADPEFGRMQAAELQKVLVKVLADPKVDVLRYDKSRILEVKPHGVSKGLAATAIQESLWIMTEKLKVEAASAAVAVDATRNSLPTSTPPSAGSSGSRFGLSVSPPVNIQHRAFPTGDGSNALSPRTQATAFHPLVLAIGDDKSDEEMFIAVQAKHFLDGRVRGRERIPYVDSAGVNAALRGSYVSTSIPQTPSHLIHDSETSPTPMSPLLGISGTTSHGSRLTAPSNDPFLFTVCVGLKPSHAHYYLNDTESVLRSLYGLVLADQEEIENGSATRADDSKNLGLSKRTAASATATSSSSSSASTRSDEGTIGLGSKRGSFGALSAALFGPTAVGQKAE